MYGRILSVGHQRSEKSVSTDSRPVATGGIEWRTKIGADEDPEWAEIQDMREIPAIKVHQWLREWDHVKFDKSDHPGTRRTPPRHFYVFSMAAEELRALSGIERRSAEVEIGHTDTGIQRRHDSDRTKEIQDYIRFGFPHAVFRPQDRTKVEYADSKMPGWLPTAIVVNIFNPDFPDVRKGRRVAEGDHVRIQDGEGVSATVILPDGFETLPWQPRELPPMEVIDGQHRLWAFDDPGEFEGYELPVVAFDGLDLTWQAYLFYTINIRPVRINASLAFDLYPLLRTENWLEHEQGPRVYRETRAQEIVRSLYTHQESPWYHHINMLGDPGRRMVRQAAWIRSLLATYIKPTSGQRTPIGGLFGALNVDHDLALDWHGAQQVAYLIYLGRTLRDQIRTMPQDWSEATRSDGHSGQQEGLDPAFYGRHSLLNTDQGIRGFLSITNDICVTNLDGLKLREWTAETFGSPDDENAVSAAIQSLSAHSEIHSIDELVTELAMFDWRTSSAPKLDDTQRTVKLAFRGSGGYREIRRRLLLHLADGESSASQSAHRALDTLGYERD